jgi:predicted glycoside hydrolase/deacetylase ChbG (UPF0249 family)
MASPKHLIVNADDFGLSLGVTRGIIRAHERGILTSASLMVRGRGATEAANYARRSSRLSLGLHIDLAEWVFRGGEWMPKYRVVPTDDPKAIVAEVARQLESFRSLVGKNPTHLDSHQHVHRNEPVCSVLLNIARELAVPLRDHNDVVQFCGDFYGQTGEGEPFPQGIAVENLLRIFSELPPGWTEVSCHPGDDEGLDSVYRTERKVEMNTLCDPRVREALVAMNIELRSFADLPQRTSQPVKP